MSYEAKGTIINIEPTFQISEKFRKREFVIEVSESGSQFTDLIKFQATQDKCDLLNGLSIGQTISVSFNLRGRKWEKDGKTSYFTNLEAWKITAGEAVANHAEAVNPELPVTASNDLPF